MSTEKRLSRIETLAPLSLSERIRGLRKRRGWSQSEFAEIVGVKQGQVSRWESGVDRPSPSSIASIARHADESERPLFLVEAGLAAYIQDGDGDMRDIPVLRDPAAIPKLEGRDGHAVELTLGFPRQWLPPRGNLFGLLVGDEAGEPVVSANGVVIVDVERRDSYDLDGHVVAIRAGKVVTIRYLRRDGGIFFLEPHQRSERFPTRLLHDAGDWSIIGEVVKVIGDPPQPKRK